MWGLLAHELVDSISQLANSVLPQKPEVSVYQPIETIDMPLGGVNHRQILSACAFYLLKGWHDFDFTNVGMVIVMSPPGHFTNGNEGSSWEQGLSWFTRQIDWQRLTNR
jgi:hypothetical protein